MMIMMVIIMVMMMMMMIIMISLNHNLVADMFVVCGVLYAVDRTDARDTKIRLALDLYTHQVGVLFIIT